MTQQGMPFNCSPGPKKGFSQMCGARYGSLACDVFAQPRATSNPTLCQPVLTARFPAGKSEVLSSIEPPSNLKVVGRLPAFKKSLRNSIA